MATVSTVMVPRQLQRLVREAGGDLGGDLRMRLPPQPRVAVQRWSVRRVTLLVLVVGGAAVAAWALLVDLWAGELL